MMRRFDLPAVFVLSVLVSVSAPAQEALKPGFRDMKWGGMRPTADFRLIPSGGASGMKVYKRPSDKLMRSCASGSAV